MKGSVVWTEATEVCQSVRLSDQIGKGRFGVVFRGIDTETGEKVAVKQIQTRGNSISQSRVAPSKIALEADIHGAVSDCPSVATLKAHWRFKDKDCLVTELCEGGDLAAYSRRHGPLQESQMAEIAREATRMIRTCHERDILHGDVKAANFVIHSATDASKLTNCPTHLQPGWLKAVDFGGSMRMGTSHHAVLASTAPPFRKGKVLEQSGNADELAAGGFRIAFRIGC